MYNKRIEIPINDLNSLNNIIIDDIYFYQIVPSSIEKHRNKNIKLYPTELQIINDTESEVEILFLSNLKEKKHFENHPEEHAFIRLPFGCIMQEDKSGLIKFRYLIIRGVSGTATKSLKIELLNYGK